MKIKPIDPTLRPILDAFLADPALQPKFAKFAKELGYRGTDPEMIKISLFTPDKENEICFASDDVYQLWLDYQILNQLKMTEPYRTLLIQKPEVEQELIKISKQVLNKEEVDKLALVALFREPQILSEDKYTSNAVFLDEDDSSENDEDESFLKLEDMEESPEVEPTLFDMDGLDS